VDIFENVLLMLVAACLLLQLSRRLALPYPSMLALAGVALGAMPWVPHISLDPHLALALFIAPALLDSAFDTAPRELRRNWLPLVSLVLVAVLLTTAAVAWAGWAFAGLPLAAAITLGAIVAPPDAVAAAAVMQQFRIPRRTLSVINGESLLNDAVALLVFGVAVSAAGSAHLPITSSLPMLLVAVPGGALVGIVFAKLNLHVGAPLFAGTRSAIIFQFVMTFGAWIVAERLHLSPIISVVAFGMTLGQYAPGRNAPRDRVHSYAVWGAVVFTLNVLAFFLMGLQARGIVDRLSGPALAHVLQFAGIVLALVIAVRVGWVLFYGAVMRAAKHRLGLAPAHCDSVEAHRAAGGMVGHAWAGHHGHGLRAADRLSGTRPDRAERVRGRARHAGDPGLHDRAADQGLEDRARCIARRRDLARAHRHDGCGAVCARSRERHRGRGRARRVPRGARAGVGHGRAAGEDGARPPARHGHPRATAGTRRPARGWPDRG
jgi:NhaP-type Na+/H+ or K+/H+ antiporter